MQSGSGRAASAGPVGMARRIGGIGALLSALVVSACVNSGQIANLGRRGPRHGRPRIDRRGARSRCPQVCQDVQRRRRAPARSPSSRRARPITALRGYLAAHGEEGARHFDRLGTGRLRRQPAPGHATERRGNERRPHVGSRRRSGPAPHRACQRGAADRFPRWRPAAGRGHPRLPAAAASLVGRRPARRLGTRGFGHFPHFPARADADRGCDRGGIAAAARRGPAPDAAGRCGGTRGPAPHSRSRRKTSGPIPKFASTRSTLRYELRKFEDH